MPQGAVALKPVSGKRLFRKTSEDELRMIGTMRQGAVVLKPVSGTRLFRKTSEWELRMPIMSDPLLRMMEPGANDKAMNWMITFPHPKQRQSREGIALVAPSTFTKAPKVAFLDDFRFDPEIISFATLCLWFDGSNVPIGRPQNERGVSPGNFMYKGTAPIFITTKLSDLAWLESQASINPHTNAPWDADASMLLRRLRVYKYTQKVGKPPARLKYCPRCFVDLVMAQAGQ